MRYALLLLFPTLALAADKDKPLQPIPEIMLDRKEPVSYEKDIEPIFADKCISCHSGTVIKSKLDMGTFDKLMKGGKRGVVIVPGKASESILYKMSGHRMNPVMPEDDDPISPQQLALVKLWIDQGAKPPAGVREKPKVIVGLPPANVTPIRAVALNADATLAVVGRGNQVNLYLPADGKFVKSLVDPELKGPDGKPVAAAHRSLIESIALSPDGKTLATGAYRELFLWDVTAGTIRKRIEGFADRVTTIAFSPDGKYLATGGGAPTEDGEVKLFNGDGSFLTDVKNAHSDTCFGLAFSPDGKLLATCGADKFVKVFEVPGAKFVKSFEGHTHHVMDVAWKSDGKLLVSAGADMNVKVWDLEKGEQLRTIPQGSRQATRVAFQGTGAGVVSACGDGSLRMFSADNGSNMKQYTGFSDYIYAVAFSKDGKMLVAGGEDGLARLYSAESGTMKFALYAPGTEPKKEEPKKK